MPYCRVLCVNCMPSCRNFHFNCIHEIFFSKLITTLLQFFIRKLYLKISDNDFPVQKHTSYILLRCLGSPILQLKRLVYGVLLTRGTHSRAFMSVMATLDCFSSRHTESLIHLHGHTVGRLPRKLSGSLEAHLYSSIYVQIDLHLNQWIFIVDTSSTQS